VIFNHISIIPNKVKVEQFAPPILLVQWMFTHVNNGITIGMWGKTHCFDVQCKLSRNSMHLSHSVILFEHRHFWCCESLQIPSFSITILSECLVPSLTKRPAPVDSLTLVAYFRKGGVTRHPLKMVIEKDGIWRLSQHQKWLCSNRKRKLKITKQS
jgi:hypothetical protein